MISAYPLSYFFVLLRVCRWGYNNINNDDDDDDDDKNNNNSILYLFTFWAQQPMPNYKVSTNTNSNKTAHDKTNSKNYNKRDNKAKQKYDLLKISVDL
jgi:hypothetical protein